MADYNINAVTRRVVYTGSAGVGPYAFTFEILDDDDLAVYFNATKLTKTTDYSVTINANGTGSVTLVVNFGGNVPQTPIASDAVIVVGARDIERTTDFVTAGDLLASSLNEQLDSLTIFDQQIAEEEKRTLQAPVYDPAHVDEGGTLDMTLPAKADRAGKYLQFNSTTGNPEAGPDSADVTAIADIATDISTLADIEDGTDATDAIQTVAGISSNVTTVANIASNVSTVAGISSDVTAVAADATDIGTVATNIANVNTVAGNISEVIAVANDLNEAVSEVETVANDLNEAVSEIETVAASITNVDAVGTNIANVNTVAGIDSNVTTVAGISSDVTTVSGVSANVTTVAGISSDVTTVAADGTDIGTVAGAISNVNTVAGISGNVTTVAGISSNVTTVATNIADVNTVAGNITGVNSFADRYRVGATDPTTSLDEGDLFFNTTSNEYKFYDGSSWQVVNVSGLGNIVEDATPQLGGNLDTNGNDINFGDNDKAVFGAGSDLQIYHDESSSRVVNATGNLKLQADILELLNESGTEQYLNATYNGAVNLYHNNAPKLSTTSGGIDVTGTVTADGLTVDGDATISSGTPTLQLTDTGGTNQFATFKQDGSNLKILSRNNTISGGILMRRNVGGTETDAIQLSSNGDISFYDSTGVTQGLFWDASTQRLGLGTTSPDTNLDVERSSNDTGGIKVQNTNNAQASAVAQVEISGGDNAYANLLLECNATNHSIRQDGSGNLKFINASTERLRIDSSGNVGIGVTSTAGGKLAIGGTGTSAAYQYMSNTGGTGYFGVSSSTGGGILIGDSAYSLVLGTGGATPLHFGTNNNIRATIDSSGNLLVATTTSGGEGYTFENNGFLTHARASGAAQSMVGYKNGGNFVGEIRTSTTATAYLTSSDYRLKENVTYDWDATTRLKQLKPARFNFIIDPDKTVDGFLAHEAQTVVPEAVTGTKDEVDDDGNPVMQGIDQSKLVPLLVKTIQELEARIAALEAN